MAKSKRVTKGRRAEAAPAQYAQCIDADTGEVFRVRLMTDSDVRDPHCLDCGVDTDAINESYMIQDDVWRAAHPAEAGMLCVKCCERRLGRKLCRNDFPPYALSAFDGGMPVSARLKLRMEIKRARPSRAEPLTPRPRHKPPTK
jgi:hypothetical protein